ncbi:MAG: HAMP domain-containing protein [Peptococcaceae bacterium]|nr:HAMP domain-containing protein [Peptococcaceae bacterium]
MSLSIEKKIMIPMLLLVLSLTVSIAAVAYWGGYQFYTNYRKDEAKKTLMRAGRFLTYEKLQKENYIGEHPALTEFLGEDAVWIEEGDFVKLPDQLTPYREQILSASREMSRDGTTEKDILLYRGSSFFSETRWLVVSYSPEKDRLLGLPVLIEPFPELLLLFYKYILLVGVLAGMLAIEITIFLSHHLTRPIKRLASICQELIPGESKYNLPIDRQDEIGILAKSFQKMIIKVEESLKEIKQMQQFNDAIFSSISTGIVTTSLDGSIILKANPAALRILKLSSQEIADRWGKNDHGLLSLLRKLCLERKSESGEPAIWEHTVKDGEETLCLSGRTDLVYNSEGESVAVMLLFEDVTEKRRLERNMERVKQLASFGEIAATLAHEIRNPLAGIKTCSQVLAGRIPSDIKTSQLVTAVSSEIDRINRLITDMLNLARPQTPKRAGVCLNDTLASICGLVSKALEDKQIHLENRLPATLPRLYMDPDHLKQILLNLILNAIKASPRGATIKISLHSQTVDLLSFIISDEGPGISLENARKIFQPFFSTDPRGTGLGLAVVQRLVNENNGEIEVVPQIGQGAHILVKLPIEAEV